jgi:protein ImuA
MTRISVGGRTTRQGRLVSDASTIFLPAFAQIGLRLDRVNFVEGDKEETALASFEEALGDAGLCAVVAERVRLPMTASRRLQLAAEKSGDTGFGDPPLAAAASG